jgi:hypothetical protein
VPDQKHHAKTLGDLNYTEDFSLFGDKAAASSPDPPVATRHYGKYRGTVVQNEDPYFQGRLMVSVPGIVIANWAMPCVPLTDVQMGTYFRPRIGANVWVEFERGDPDKPIWVGCFWGKIGEPLAAKASKAVPPINAVITLETATAGISICDIPFTGGNVTLSAGAQTTSIRLTPAGIIITAPTVTVNTGAFNVVTPTGTFNVV